MYNNKRNPAAYFKKYIITKNSFRSTRVVEYYEIYYVSQPINRTKEKNHMIISLNAREKYLIKSNTFILFYFLFNKYVLSICSAIALMMQE